MPSLTPLSSRVLGQVTSGSGVPMCSWAQDSVEGYPKISRKLCETFFQPNASKKETDNTKTSHLQGPRSSRAEQQKEAPGPWPCYF